MRSRYPSSSTLAYSFGPGPLTSAIKAIVIANVVAFVVSLVFPTITRMFGLRPADIFGQLYLWQPVTYLFLHAGFMHLIFNMLALWMFGVDLERRWGRTAFLRYYFVCGIGAGLTCVAVGLLPLATSYDVYRTPTIGASGAIYGLLLAYAIFFPNRIIYYFIFPIPVRIYVLLAGLLVLYESARGGGGVAHFAHLGGLIFGYLYLSLGRGGPWAEIKYRYVKWRMNRLRKRFDVHQGGRRWDSKVH